MILFAEVECMIHHAHSLKEKRSVVKRISKRIENDFNVAISEMDYQDLWQRTMFGLVTIANEKVQAERVIDQCLKLIDSFPEIERTNTHVEWL
ncbi:hypothetical protein GCM10011351_04500 [Paraliobacillus quinghaiensis]|uniref:DUF503 domain-containing protein n=1 Tax=Paraliobacillus quinghaiensis TaxID=470815 RepID=A0A917WPT4_9BACI|nr:DUF503 domain-containing protein [Paraliobacillus quinghaiensis]GGM21742.1 hypothetical protein GCM10011351_04500 [Paraliobacillus quinghaiensis]